MVDNRDVLIKSILRAGAGVALAFTIGSFIDGWYLGLILSIPAVCFVGIFRKKAPLCRELCPEESNKKAVIMLYFRVASADDFAEIESAAIYAKSANPQENIKLALMIDTIDHPMEKAREDNELLTCAENLARRLNGRSDDFVAVVRSRCESEPQLEFIGRGRKTGALFDLAELILEHDINPLAVYGNRKILENARFIAVCNSAYELNMDSVTKLMEYACGDEIAYPEDDERFCGRGLINVKALASCRGDIPYDKTLFCNRLLAGVMGERRVPVKFKSIKREHSGDRLAEYAEQVRETAQSLWHILSRKMKIYQKVEVLGNLAYFLTPVIITALLPLSLAMYPPAAGGAFLAALAMYLLGSWARKGRGVLWEMLLVPTYAAVTIFALIREAYRVVFMRNTLSVVPFKYGRFVIIAEIISLCALRSPSGAVKLIALIFALMPIKLLAEMMPKKEPDMLSYRRKKALNEQAEKVWKFFEEYVTEADNNLPPESVQFSPDGIAHVASPAGIGTYLVSCLAAYDKKLIDLYAFTTRIERTLETVAKLETANGNLYDKYDTRTLTPLSRTVSDSEIGLWLICLICLKEGTEELRGTFSRLDECVNQIEEIISKADLSQVENSYCFSSGRLASFLAVALRQRDKSHWQELSRPIRLHGFKQGIAAQQGGIDEFFVSELFIKSPEGSASEQSLDFCLYCHKRLAKEKNAPYGLAHSGCAERDESMCYLTRHHGAKLCTAEETAEGYVVSPYSIYLCAQRDPSGAFEALDKLKDLGTVGRYGFYEAYDFGLNEVVKCYNSLHLGLEMIAISNLTDGGIMQKRTMQSTIVQGAYELLNEAIPKADKSAVTAPTAPENKCERYTDISLSEPRVRFCHSNGYALIMTDSGNCFGVYKGAFVYESGDGMKIKIGENESLPYLCEFAGSESRYYWDNGGLSSCITAFLHGGLPCEMRSICLENNSDEEISTSVQISFTSGSIGGVSMRADNIILRTGKMYIQVGFSENMGCKILPERTGFRVNIPIALPPRGKWQASIYILCADSLDGLKQSAKRLIAEQIKPALAPDKSGETRMAEIILRDILTSSASSLSASENLQRQFGFEKTLPLVAVMLNNKNDSQKLSLYLGAFKALCESDLEINLAFIYRDDGDRAHYRALIDELKLRGLEEHIYSQIMPIDLSDSDDGTLEKIRSVANHIAKDSIL